MRAVCAVAHPDDCVIFAYSLIKHFVSLDWHIVYLTYQLGHPRADEFARFWQQRNITTQFLGFQDTYDDVEQDCISFDSGRARTAVEQSLHFADIVLTHDSDGDYGHPHHRFMHQCAYEMYGDDLITFAKPNRGSHTYSITDTDYDQQQLPLHYNVIKSFHAVTHTNSYDIPPKIYNRITNA